MLDGGYQILDLSGLTFVDHEIYLATSEDDKAAVEKAKKLIEALKSAHGRKPFIVGGTINISTTETVDDEGVIITSSLN